jgi:hypothetical protein
MRAAALMASSVRLPVALLVVSSGAVLPAASSAWASSSQSRARASAPAVAHKGQSRRAR